MCEQLKVTQAEHKGFPAIRFECTGDGCGGCYLEYDKHGVGVDAMRRKVVTACEVSGLGLRHSVDVAMTTVESDAVSEIAFADSADIRALDGDVFVFGGLSPFKH